MHYQYQCFDCQTIYPPEEFEESGNYLCPDCGKAEKNQPLTGVMQVVYDYSVLRKSMDREQFLKNTPGTFWDYPEFWPLALSNNNNNPFKNISKQQLQLLSLTQKPILRFPLETGTISIFDDTRNPTFSYKDRASILVALKAIQKDIAEITMASTGNAGSSIAGICARLGLKSHIFVPANIPLAKRLQIQAYGAELYLLDGDYDQAFDLNLEVTAKTGWYNRNTAYNPLTIEGKKSAAFDMFIALQGTLPDVIFVPVGDGVIIAGIYKGFYDLLKLGWIEKTPKLVAVQASGSNAIVRYFESGHFEYEPAQTIADSIHAGAPRNLYMAAAAIEKSHGWALSVSDQEMLNAQQAIATKMGMLIEPAAAASFAGYQKSLTYGQIEISNNVMLMFTGNGLKDFSSLQNWNTAPVPQTIEQIKTHFTIT